MSELISGKEALIALANGEEVQFCDHMGVWHNAGIHTHTIGLFLNDCYEFRLKPRTITINGVELNQCYSVAIDYARNEVKVEFKNRNDAEALHDVISKLYGFK
jgi:hypothetical protein